MNEEKTELILPSNLDSIEQAAALAADFAAKVGVAEDDLFGIDLSVRETVANAIKHGNKEDETKQVRVTFERTEQNLIITVQDEGAGFDFDHLPDPTNAENLMKTSGRGIFIIKNFLDSADWAKAQNGGTIVKLTKKI
ncbi:MAG: ATP-binding protein [Pyrinomonadaceae bacterium]|nr:ATP-binding protein [Pyrinomonadaceae bacterium]